MTDLHHDIFCKRLFDRIKDRIGNPGTRDETLSEYSFLQELIDDYSCLMDECGSPIEKMLGAQLLFSTDGYNPIRYIMAGNDFPPNIDGWGTALISQARVGKFRVDFLVICHLEGDTAKLIIECDGHAYHDKTKQQASHDKARDRRITALGIPVYRFTGSDIYHHSNRCKDEIESLISALMDGLLISHGKIADYRRVAHA